MEIAENQISDLKYQRNFVILRVKKGQKKKVHIKKSSIEEQIQEIHYVLEEIRAENIISKQRDNTKDVLFCVAADFFLI